MRLGGAEEKSADIDACDASMRTTWCARLSVGVDGFCWIAKLGCTVFCHRPVVRDLAVAGELIKYAQISSSNIIPDLFD